MNTYFEIIDESQLLPCPSTFQPSPIHTKPNNNNNTDTNPSSSLHDELEILISASLHKKRKGGRKKFQETRHPIYRGVRYRKGKWVCEVREPKKATRIWLGTYPTPEMAARAHDVGVLAIKGTSAILNFPNSSYDLPIIDSSSSKEIREAAKQVAEVFRPSNYYSSSLFNSDDGMKKKKTRCNNSSNDKKGITTKVDDDPLIDEKKIQEIVLDSSSLFMHNTTSCGDDDVVNSNDDSGLGEKNNDDSDQNNDQLNRSAAAATMLLDDEATLFNMRDCWDWDWDGIMEEGLCNFQMSSMQSSSNHYYSLDWDVATAASSMDFNLWTDY